MDKLLFNDPNAFNEEYLRSLGHILLPTDVGGLFSGFSGAIAWGFNKDLFRQKNIIPASDVNELIMDRNTDYASKFSKMVMKGSDLMTRNVEGDYKIDPRMLDAAITGQFSYWGNFWLKSWETVLPGESQNKYKFDFAPTKKGQRKYGGFVRQAYHPAEVDVKWVLQAAYVNDKLAESSGYSSLRGQITKYWDPEIQNDKALRREVGSQMREDAKLLREEFEPDMMNIYKRAKERKERGKGAPTL